MDDKPYTVGKWRDQDNYECKHCPFATTSEAVALAHYAQRHVRRPTPPPSPILTADKSGREVKPEITIEVPESVIAEAVVDAMDKKEAEKVVDEALAKATKTVMEREPAKPKPPAKRKTKSKEN